MSRIAAPTLWLPIVALMLSGCYAPSVRHVSGDAPLKIDVRASEPALVRLDHDSVVRYAKIRLVGDTLYGWEPREHRAPKDSIAVALRRVISIEQTRLNVAATAGAVVASALGVVLAGFIALILILQTDHS